MYVISLNASHALLIIPVLNLPQITVNRAWHFFFYCRTLADISLKVFKFYKHRGLCVKGNKKLLNEWGKNSSPVSVVFSPFNNSVIEGLPVPCGVLMRVSVMVHISWKISLKARDDKYCLFQKR